MCCKGIVYRVLRMLAGYSVNVRPVRKNPCLPWANRGFNLYINILGHLFRTQVFGFNQSESDLFEHFGGNGFRAFEGITQSTVPY